MKIQSLSIDNIGKIAHFEMNPNGKSCTIKGANNAGKTTILSSIALALSQVEGVKVMPAVVKKGEKKGTITLSFDNGMTIERVIRPDTTTKKLLVKNADGSRLSQTLINDMFSLISFKLDSTIDFDTLKKDSGLDLDEIAEKKKDLYANRTDANRIKKEKAAIFDAIDAPRDDWPTKKPSVDPLLKEQKEREAMAERNRVEKERVEDINSRREISIESAEKVKEQIRYDIEEIKREIAELEKRKTKLLSEDLDINKKIDSLKAQPPEEPSYEKWEGTEDIEGEIAKVSDKVDLFNKRVAYGNAKMDLESANKEAEKADTSYKKALKEETEMIAGADFGIPDLSLDIENKTVLYKGLPFDSMSKSEGLMVGLRWLAARNPKMRFATSVQIEDYLDDDNFKAFHALAEELGIQIINEQVRSIDPEAIEITEV